MSDRWHAGHRLQIAADNGELGVLVVCPHDGQDWTAAEFGDRPNCRQPYTEDGEPDLSSSGLRAAARECMVALYAGEEMVTAAGVPLTDVPVEYSWDGGSAVAFRPTAAAEVTL